MTARKSSPKNKPRTGPAAKTASSASKSASHASENLEFSIDRDAVTNYLLWSHVIIILLVTVWFFGIGIVFAVLYYFTIGKWLPRKQADALRYWIEGNTLRIEEGVYFLNRKAVPLDRITDVVASQGPLLRRFGIWALKVQTAGRGQGMPEGLLYGVSGPEDARDRILAAREAAMRSKS
ncbi:MAG: PH domain-containing protein [Planctomycetes bacterium]|nr:PH domain-containing protein [Planctomycetota bacterium]